jgi:hypothetical protein
LAAELSADHRHSDAVPYRACSTSTALLYQYRLDDAPPGGRHTAAMILNHKPTWLAASQVLIGCHETNDQR